MRAIQNIRSLTQIFDLSHTSYSYIGLTDTDILKQKYKLLIFYFGFFI